MHLKSSSGQTIFPLHGSDPQNVGDSSSPEGQSEWLSQRYLKIIEKIKYDENISLL